MANICEDAPIDWNVAGFWGFMIGAIVCFWVAVGMFLNGSGADMIVAWMIGTLFFAGMAFNNVQRNI